MLLRKTKKSEKQVTQARKLTDVTGRINSSNARRAHTNPRSRVLHARGLLVIFSIVAGRKGSRPRGACELEGLGPNVRDTLRQGCA
jgi:hypothetical protein